MVGCTEGMRQLVTSLTVTGMQAVVKYSGRLKSLCGSVCTVGNGWKFAAAWKVRLRCTGGGTRIWRDLRTTGAIGCRALCLA